MGLSTSTARRVVGHASSNGALLLAREHARADRRRPVFAAPTPTRRPGEAALTTRPSSRRARRLRGPEASRPPPLGDATQPITSASIFPCRPTNPERRARHRAHPSNIAGTVSSGSGAYGVSRSTASPTAKSPPTTALLATPTRGDPESRTGVRAGTRPSERGRGHGAAASRGRSSRPGDVPSSATAKIASRDSGSESERSQRRIPRELNATDGAPPTRSGTPSPVTPRPRPRPRRERKIGPWDHPRHPGAPRVVRVGTRESPQSAELFRHLPSLPRRRGQSRSPRARRTGTGVGRRPPVVEAARAARAARRKTPPPAGFLPRGAPFIFPRFFRESPSVPMGTRRAAAARVGGGGGRR